MAGGADRRRTAPRSASCRAASSVHRPAMCRVQSAHESTTVGRCWRTAVCAARMPTTSQRRPRAKLRRALQDTLQEARQEPGAISHAAPTMTTVIATNVFQRCIERISTKRDGVQRLDDDDVAVDLLTVTAA
eukprot:420497-Prymnesium_polylepis.2